MSLRTESMNIAVATLVGRTKGLVRFGHNSKPQGYKSPNESFFISVVNVDDKVPCENTSFGTISYSDARDMALQILRVCEEKLIADKDFSGPLSPAQAEAAVEAGLKVVAATKCYAHGTPEQQWVVYKDHHGTWVMRGDGSKHRYTSGFDQYREWKVWSGKFATSLADSLILTVLKERPGAGKSAYTLDWTPGKSTLHQSIDTPVAVKDKKPLTSAQAMMAMVEGKTVIPYEDRNAPSANKRCYFLDGPEVVFRLGVRGARLSSPVLPSKRGPGGNVDHDDTWMVLE